MKKITVILLLAIIFLAGVCWGEELKAVEKLNEIEILQLKGAKDSVKQAQTKLKKLEDQIAKDHKMRGETYMEWSSWYEIKGEFILFYYQSNMEPKFIIHN